MTPRAPISATGLRAAATARLAAAGVDSAAADASWLLGHVLGVEPGRLLLVDEVPAEARRTYEDLIARRGERIPLQHLTGRAPFAGLDLEVGPGVFVPRPETELLVEWAVTECAARTRGPIPVADLCAGSGALALAIATAVPSVEVVAVERSDAALEYLRRNVAAQPPSVAGRVRVVAGDVTDPQTWERIGACELIVCNPPYVPAAARVAPEVAHDPADAVFSGADGMALIEALVPRFRAALPPGGAVAVEHDDTTAGPTVTAFTAGGGFAEVTSRSDLSGRPRFVTARRTGAARAPDAGVQGWNP